MICSSAEFVGYFEGIRRRTLNVARALPPERIDWSPAVDEFTCGDILRHVAALETISVHAVVEGRWQSYPGHQRELAPDMWAVLALLEATHAQSMHLLNGLPDAALYQPCLGLDGRPVKGWRLLMAMVEHEIHHRSQLASYLSWMGIKPPHLFGLGVEDVVVQSAKLAGEEGIPRKSS